MGSVLDTPRARRRGGADEKSVEGNSDARRLTRRRTSRWFWPPPKALATEGPSIAATPAARLSIEGGACTAMNRWYIHKRWRRRRRSALSAYRPTYPWKLTDFLSCALNGCSSGIQGSVAQLIDLTSQTNCRWKTYESAACSLLGVLASPASPTACRRSEADTGCRSP